MLKALNRLLRRALLFYRKLVKDLQKHGLKMNTYNPYLFNDMKNGKQLTVILNVDDLKVTHMVPFEITFFT